MMLAHFAKMGGGAEERGRRKARTCPTSAKEVISGTRQGSTDKYDRPSRTRSCLKPNMMEVVLTRLRDFSCKATTFGACTPAGVCRDPRSRKGFAAGEENKMDIESALAWLRRELMEMRSQDQALIRQLMELHSGIQELKQELSEEEDDELDEEGSSWDSESEQGSVYYSSVEELSPFPLPKKHRCLHSTALARKSFSRRSSVP